MPDASRTEIDQLPSDEGGQEARSSSASSFPILPVALGALALLAGATWAHSRSREAPLDERTRDRLRRREPRHQAPSAADIRVD